MNTALPVPYERGRRLAGNATQNSKHTCARPSTPRQTFCNSPDVRHEALIGVCDADVRANVARMLRDIGYSSVAFGDGFHLIEWIADAVLETRGENPPELIVADNDLVGCTGMSLLRGLRELHWKTPFALLRGRFCFRIRPGAGRYKDVFVGKADSTEFHEFCARTFVAQGAVASGRLPSENLGLGGQATSLLV